MNKKICNSITYIIHTTFIVVFFIHVTIVVISIFNPEIPDVESSQQTLDDIEFPISFRICIHDLDLGDPKTNNQKFKEAGYHNYYAFFKGRSLYKRSHYGFLGHLPNGSTKFGSFEGDVGKLFLSQK